MAGANSMPGLKLDELVKALEYVSAGESFDAAAYVSRESGEILFVGPDLEPEDGWPEDLEDSDRFVAVPTKQELDLGRLLALRFTEAQIPEALDEVHRAFARAGARHDRSPRMRIDTQADVEAATARLARRPLEALACFIVVLAQDGGPVGEHVRRFVVADDPRAIADALRAGIQAIGAGREPVARAGAEVGVRMEWLLEGIESWVLPGAAREAFDLLVELIERDGAALEACRDEHLAVSQAVQRAVTLLERAGRALPAAQVQMRLQSLLAADEYGVRAPVAALLNARENGG